MIRPEPAKRLSLLALALLACLLLIATASRAQEEPKEQAKKQASPTVSIPEHMDTDMMQEMARVKEQLGEQARSLFEHTPFGFDLGTFDRLRKWAMTLPLQIPTLIEDVMDQLVVLGIAGSLIMLAFLVAVFYSLFGQKKVLQRLEKAVTPLKKRMPEGFYPYFLSILKVVVASLIPLLLYGAYSLIFAIMASYREPWFLFTGQLLKLWMVGALLINLLRESLTHDLFPIPSRYGVSIFRIARIIVLYIILSIAVFWGAEAFRIPDEFLALLKFCISLSIVFVFLLLLLKKKSIVGILPDLPYRSYAVFKRGLERYYFPAIFLTFLTGLLWCAGFHRLCLALWPKTWAVAGSFLGIMLAYHILLGWLRKWIEKREAEDPKARPVYNSVRALLLYATVFVILLITTDLLGVLDLIQRALSFPVLRVGETPLSMWTFIKAIFILLAFLFLSRLLRAFLDYRVYPSIGVDEGLAYAINTFLNYFLLGIGFLFAMRAVGLDFRVLMVFAGAIGIGIGLGFQSTAANLISGFSLVFGRRIGKGDWIQVADTLGYVEEVSLRATKVRTRDNIEYLIPNADLTSNTIVNYSLSDPLVRIHVAVGVSYKANPREVEKILLQAASDNPNINKVRKPQVWFTEYGDSSINFALLAWIDIRKTSQNETKSQLYFTIFDQLAAAGIEIPFPQRDLHIRSGLTWPGKEEKS